MLESLFNKAEVPRASNFVMEDPTQLLSCEICKLSEFTNLQNNYFEEICECLLLNFI